MTDYGKGQRKAQIFGRGIQRQQHKIALRVLSTLTRNTQESFWSIPFIKWYSSSNERMDSKRPPSPHSMEPLVAPEFAFLYSLR
jgi:hypothetical protein